MKRVIPSSSSKAKRTSLRVPFTWMPSSKKEINQRRTKLYNKINDLESNLSNIYTKREKVREGLDKTSMRETPYAFISRASKSKEYTNEIYHKTKERYKLYKWLERLEKKDKKYHPALIEKSKKRREKQLEDLQKREKDVETEKGTKESKSKAMGGGSSGGGGDTEFSESTLKILALLMGAAIILGLLFTIF